MGAKTGISWTNATWNPIRGCSRVSEGCRNCYAEKTAYRYSGPGLAYEGLVRIGADGKRRPEWNGQIAFVEKHLLDPLRWKEPRRIFVNSMSDLFHENVTDGMRDRIFAVMALAPQHTFQVLTKRPERMLAYLRDPEVWPRVVTQMEALFDQKHATEAALFQALVTGMPLPNVWLGVSVEDQKTADARIPLLLQTPAAVRFISAEPLLGAVDLRELNGMVWFFEYMTKINPMQAILNMNNEHYPKHCPLDALTGKCPAAPFPGLDWVICGGESGPGARPMHPDWARGLRDQCVAAGVPFFFKEWGAWGFAGELQAYPGFAGGTAFNSIGGSRKSGIMLSRHSRTTFAFERRDCSPTLVMERVGAKAAGDLLDGKQWQQYPEVR